MMDNTQKTGDFSTVFDDKTNVMNTNWVFELKKFMSHAGGTTNVFYVGINIGQKTK